MLVGSRQGIAILEGEFSLSINNVSLSKVKKSKCLRLQIDEHLTQEAPIESVAKKVVCSLAMLKNVRKCINPDNLVKMAINQSLNHISTAAPLFGMPLASNLQINYRGSKTKLQE